MRWRCVSRLASGGRDEDDDEADAAESALLGSIMSCADGDARARFGERHVQDVSFGAAARRMEGVVTPGVAGMF